MLDKGVLNAQIVNTIKRFIRLDDKMIVCDRCKNQINYPYWHVKFNDSEPWDVCENCLHVVRYCNIALNDIISIQTIRLNE